MSIGALNTSFFRLTKRAAIALQRPALSTIRGTRRSASPTHGEVRRSGRRDCRTWRRGGCDRPHMGSSRSRGDSLVRAPAHLVSSVCVGVCRYLAFGSWPRRWRARDEGQGCEAPAKPACAERTSLTRVSRSPKLAVRSEMAHRTRTIDPVHIFTFQYPGPEPDCLTRPVSEPDQPHIRSPLETAAPTSRLLRAGAQANETILPIGI